MFEVTGLVLEVAEVKEYQGAKYQSIVARVNDKLLKFKVDLNKIQFTPKDVDKEYELVLDLYGSASVPALVRVVSYK